MSFNYEAVNKITNQDYISQSRDLLARCKDIEQKYSSKNFKECCRDVRTVNEDILRYIYERLMGYRRKMPMAGEILRDVDFRNKLDDVQLTIAAQEVQNIGSKYAHGGQYQNETVEQYEARIKQNEEALPIYTEKILEQFSIVIERAVSYINDRIPGIRGFLRIERKNLINEKNGKEESVLEASVEDVRNPRDYIYVWRIEGQTAIFREKTRRISLNQPWIVGKVIILEATNNKINQTLQAQYGPIKKDEIVIRAAKGNDTMPATAKENGMAPSGKLAIEKDSSYRGGGVKLEAKVENADYNLTDDDVIIEWGFVGESGNFVRSTKEGVSGGASFRCSLKKRSLGRSYICKVFRKGYSVPLEAEFRKLTEEDFAIDGIVRIRFDSSESALRATVENSNYQGQPVYKWYRNGKAIENKNDRFMKISEEDIDAAYECEISHDEYTFSKKTQEPFVVTAEMVEPDEEIIQSPKIETKEESLKLSIGEHEGEKVIWAVVEGHDRENKEYIFNWSVRKTDGKTVSKQYKGPHLGLKGIKSGEIVSCKAVDSNNGIFLEATLEVKGDSREANNSSVAVKESEFTPNQIQDSIKAKDTSVKTKANHERRPAHETGHEFAHNDTEDKKKIETVKELSEVNDELKLPYEIKRISEADKTEFFTSASLVHYFVRPNDYFVLNSLEMVDSDVYSYRLLKHSGFENIYLVEVEGTECVIYAYDDQSASSFPKEKKEGEKKELSGLTALRKKGESSSDRSSENNECDNGFGKRAIRRFSTDAEFRMQFATAIKNALEDKTRKTAVIMPVRIFGKDGYCSDPVIDTLGSLVKTNETDNALIITLPNKSDFLECFKPRQTAIHDWANVVLDEAGSTNRERLIATIDYLLAHGRLVIADEYKTDEFANLLLRKVIVENDTRLAAIDSNKIFAVAESLRDFFMNKSTTEKYRTLKKIRGNVIKELNKQLENDLVVRELIQKADSLKPVRNGYSSKINPLQVERVYHDYYDRYSDDNSLADVMEQFERFSGDETQEIISQIKGVVSFLADERQRIDENRENGTGDEEMPYMNMVFLGNPGTGKTTIAKLTAKYMKAVGVLPTDRFEYITASGNIRGIVGETAANIREAAQKAIGGVLMIDEFQGFEEAYNGGNIAKNALEAIVSTINEHRDDVCIIIAGYKEGVENVLKHDQGADRRFPQNNRFVFKDFSSDTLIDILHNLIKKRGESLEDGVDEILRTVIENKIEDPDSNFGNAGYIESELLPALEISKSKRQKGAKVITVEDVNDAFPNMRRIRLSREEILAKFDALIGEEMQVVKNQIMESVEVFKDAQKSIAGMKNRGQIPDDDDMPYMNMIFEGGPGTGKTTIAKLTAKYLREEGVLPTDKYVYITATENVEGTVGKTEERIREAARNAYGGVLFIDEFQGFDKGHSNGNMAQDAMSAIVSIVNEHREDMCIILAGYKEGVEKVLRFDVGAKRRFPNRITFKDYSVDTLMMILDARLERLARGVEDDAKPFIREVIEKHKKESKGSFGNGGYIKDELLPTLDRKRLKRPDNNGVYIKQDVLDAFPDIFGSGEADRDWKPRKLSASEMENIPVPYDMVQRSDKELQEVTDRAILYVTTDHGQGTAFLIHPEGYALTCNHVIRDSKEIKARVRIKGRVGGDDSEHKCTVVNAREDLDMAIIKLEGSNFPYLPVAKRNREIVKGEHFILSGYPFGKRTAQGLTTYQGSVATGGEHKDSAGYVMYLINSEAKSGNSGSPVISLVDGLVIGILRGSLDERSSATKTEEINYMRPAYYFWEEFVKNSSDKS